jgi:nondiscriminating glutamyl-tRNA synthetase
VKPLKVRFAPSPTGPLHIGGARSALFNYLFAEHHNAQLVLRIEDTDLERSRREYEDEIISSLRWLGLTWAEGVDTGGENGPYRQTERLDLYRRYEKQLLVANHAYYCFCSADDLEQERQSLISKGETPRYLGKCRHLSPQAVEEKLRQGLKPTVRFQVPAAEIIEIPDLVRGPVRFATEEIGDFIIVKSDGIPTYNFAVVIDDTLMDITHVIRAEEHLSNTPRQWLIYSALGFPAPEFAHISLILGADRQKMSKRHGATSLIQYREIGYLPEALFNFLGFLGWSPEGEEQILSREEFTAAFTLERVSKSPAVFDLNKLNWLNHQYLLKKSLADYALLLEPFLKKSAYYQSFVQLTPEQKELFMTGMRSRLVFLSEVEEYLQLLFGPLQYSPESEEVLAENDVLPVLNYIKDHFPADTSAANVETFLKNSIKTLKIKPKQLYMPLRCALSGQIHGMELPVMINIWGQKEFLSRLQLALGKINGNDC